MAGNPHTLDQQAILQLLTSPKTATQWSGWQPRNNHAGHVLGTAILLDHNGVTIPAVTLQLEVKADLVAQSCFFLFSLMWRSQPKRTRIYQLEVVPASKRSHNAVSVIHGPHEHIGSDEPSAVADPAVNCSSWDAAAMWFFARANINPGVNIQNPFQP